MNNVQDINVIDVVNKLEQAATIEPVAATEATVDMIDACRQILLNHAIAPEQLAIYDNAATLNSAKGMSNDTQRVALNQYWHLQMGPFGRLSHQQRFKLIDNGTIKDWLSLFSQGPVQFIIDNQLPVKF